MTNNFYVYMWTNLTSGKRYVGKGKGRRAEQHARQAKRPPKRKDSLLVRAMRKHGIDKFNLTILHSGMTAVEALEIEAFYITGLRLNVTREYGVGVFGYGYNQTDGGEGCTGRSLSQEEKNHLSKTLRGKTFTEEHKASLREAAKNRPRRPKKRIVRLRDVLTPEEMTARRSVSNSKLTEQQKMTIRARRAEGRTYQQLVDEFCEKYGVSSTTIQRAVKPRA